MTTSPPRTRPNVLLALAALVVLGIGLSLAIVKLTRQPDVPGLLWPDPPRIGHFALTGDDGTPLTQDDLRGRWTLMFFGFTHCPDVCPGTLAVLKQSAERIASRPGSLGDVQVLFVSVDPARDTPEVLGPYVKHFGSAFRGATGDAQALAALTQSLGVFYAKVPGAGENDYSIDHTASIFVVDPQLRVLSAIGLPHAAADIEQRLRALADFAKDR